MKLSLPYFRNRRYLTGIDWVVGALHEAGKKSIGNGAISQAILEVSGLIDPATLQHHLEAISNRFPLLHGHFSRDWFNLAPYWKVPRSTKSIPLQVVEVSTDDEADHRLVEHVNLPFESDRQHLRLMLIHIGQTRSKLGLVFDHRLFDAYGAECFFRLLDESFSGRLEEVAAKVKTTEPAHLDHWMRRFSSGKTLNRLLIRLQEQDICALAMPTAKAKRRICFVHESISADQTALINQRAFKEIGVPILLPSAAARAVDAFRQTIPASPLPGSQYLLFTSANMRAAGQEWESIFFNHFSFLLFAVPQDPSKTVKELAIALRDQMFQHMKDKVPFAMEDAAALGRIFPRSIVSRVINSMFKGRMCSFYFACLKETGFVGTTFMGLPAVNLIHTPLAFAPPGLNLCMTFFAGRFNLVLSYLEGAMEPAAAREMLSRFKASL